MYTIEENARMVIALLKKHNIRHIVISPGGTNIPIAQGVQDDPFFSCYSVVDERSAMYFAIGLYLQLGVPIATSCTSAQATRNYIPGLTEAFYKHVPILAITTSKHPRYLYQEYMQSPDQTSLPKDAVKAVYALPYVNDENNRVLCERQINEAILELTHRTPGPVQLNLQMLDSETRIFKDIQLPDLKKIERLMLWDEWNLSFTNKKIMIVIGEHRPFKPEQLVALERFVLSYDVFVYANHLSNYHGEFALNANLMLATLSSSLFSEKYKPDLLITIGGQTGDYPLYNQLVACNTNAFEHWRVAEDGNVVDTYGKLTKIFECPFYSFFERILIERKDEKHTYFELWKDLVDKSELSMDLPFSNTYTAQQLHKRIPANSYLNFAILNSLRVWSYFPLDPSVICNANVAAFGIDGCTSVLLGQSVSTDRLCFLVIGDLAFFYDMNSLGIRQLKNNVRILLVNNDGGAEFKLNQDYSLKLDEYIAASGHNATAKGWSEENGFCYLKASDKKEFLENVNIFTNYCDRSIVFEVFVNSLDEVAANQIMIEVNAQRGLVGRIKKELTNLIGKNNISKIKKIFDR